MKVSHQMRYKNVFGSQMSDNQKEKIVLHSQNALKRFTVFEDREIGIHRQYRNQLQPNDVEEDCQSTEEVIEYGLQECIRILKEGENEGTDMHTKLTVKRRKKSL